MTEQELRLKYINCAKAFIGVEQGTPRHKHIVDTYNSVTPHPRDYALTYTAPWCAAFVSAMAILCDMTDIIPVECSCNEQIELWKALGCWEEYDAHTPKIGEIVYYDWQDGMDYAETDNTGRADHAGIVVWCVGGNMLVIEGNQGDLHSVGYRELNVNGRYIRGYGIPDFALLASSSADTQPKFQSGYCAPLVQIVQYGATGAAVRALQAILNAYGANLVVDGSFGPLTYGAVRTFQMKNGLEADGSVGPLTWGKLLNG